MADLAEHGRRAFATAGLGGLAAWAAGAGTMLRPATSKAGTVGAARTHDSLLDVDVSDFGARGDGHTDDSGAINAAFRHARETRVRASGLDLGCRIVFPAGAYVVASSLDLTGIRRINTIIDGQGSVIVGRCGGPVIDALGSRWLTIRDLTIMGDREHAPSTGLQIGIASRQAVADDHRFEDLKIIGRFGLSCLYNRGAETSAFDHVLLWNDAPGGYCLIQDGLNHFGVTSAFVQGELDPDSDLSFNENLFVNCDFRHGGGGTPVWLGDTTRHAFIRCYSATSGGPSFLLRCGPNSHTMLDVDCHCESAGLRNVFTFSSPEGRARVRGFSYRDHTSYAEEFVFTADAPMDVYIENAVIDVARYRSPTCRVFADHARFDVTGTYYSSSSAAWNGRGIFRGRACLGRRMEDYGSMGPRAGFGKTDERPGGFDIADAGQLYFDTSLGKLLVWRGTGWVDATGTAQ